MNRLFTFGYSARDFAEFRSQIARLDALVVDIRLSPRSRWREWTREHLEGALTTAYAHMGEFGNANYRSSGPVSLIAPERGIARVEALTLGRPLVLLCACTRRNGCHRSDVAGILRERLDLDDAGELFAPRFAPQRSIQLELS